jgi:pimeloyl-ACP methyl ester carboxylesterase
MNDEHPHHDRRTRTMPIRTHRRLPGALTAAALATVSLASFASAASADARPTPAKPTIVLVHGAFADASGFARVIDRLRADGYPVRAAPTRLIDVQSDAATVRGLLDSIKGPKILVGHSYGGAVITQAASGDPDVKALVYVAAFALDSNELLSDLANRPVAHPLPPLPTIPVQSKQPDGTTATDIYLDPAAFRDRFAGDLPRRVAADLAATQPPTGAATFASKLTVQPAWKTIPSWYLVAKQDRAIAPDLERFMARRIHAHTRQINGSHAVYISHPKAVADLVVQAARGTKGR